MKLVKQLFFKGFGLLIFLLTFSCHTYSDEEIQGFDYDIQEYIHENNFYFTRSESGLYYNIINQGNGPKTKITDIVRLTYKGKLLDGRVFENQKDPIEFEVKQLIEGFKEGLEMCSSGAEIELIVPPQLGYGNNELNDIPANSILFYSIKVLEIR